MNIQNGYMNCKIKRDKVKSIYTEQLKNVTIQYGSAIYWGKEASSPPIPANIPTFFTAMNIGKKL
jgi:hypothetical protein